jgi:hypothetical protein
MDGQMKQAQRPGPARGAQRGAGMGDGGSAGGDAAALGPLAQRANAGPHASSLAGLRSVVAQRECGDCEHVRLAMGGAEPVQRAARVETEPAAHMRAEAVPTSPGASGGDPLQMILIKVRTKKSDTGDRVISAVEFEGRVPTVVSGSQGDHTVAETLAQQALIRTCEGKTHPEAAIALWQMLGHLHAQAVARVGAHKEKLGFDEVAQQLDVYTSVANDPHAEGEDRNTALETFLEGFLRLWNKYPGSAYARSKGLTQGGGKEKEAIGYVRDLDRTTSREGAEEHDVSTLARQALELIDFVPAQSLQDAVTHVSRAVELILSSVPDMELYNQDVAMNTAYAYAEKHRLSDGDTQKMAKGVLDKISPRPEYEDGSDEEEHKEQDEDMQ